MPSPNVALVSGELTAPLRERCIWGIFPKAATQQVVAALADAAVSTRGSEAQETTAAKLRTVFALRNLTGPLPTFARLASFCSAARRSGHSLCLQMPFNIHALMENSDDGDHFATGLEIDRMPAYQRLEISSSDQNRAAVSFSLRNVFKHVDDVVGVGLSLLDRPLPRRIGPDILQIPFRHRRKHLFLRHQVLVF